MGTDRTVRSRPHAGAPPEHSGGASSSHARSHTALTKCADSPVLGCPELALRGRPGHPRTVVTTCAMGDRHSSRRMDTTARGHGERIIALRQQRAAFGVQGCVGRWPCHTRARADAVGGTPHFSGSDRCVAPRAATRSEGPHRSRSGPFPGRRSCQSLDGRFLRWSAMRYLCATSRPRSPCTGRGSGIWVLPWRPGGTQPRSSEVQM
jgi:hypothetical protein